MPVSTGANRAETASGSTGLPPLWLRGVLSVWLIGHLAAVTISHFDIPNGPWSALNGAEGPPPVFIQMLAQWVAPYVVPIRINTSGRFASSRPQSEGVDRLQVEYLDAAGKILQIQTFPAAHARAAVQHRQQLLVQRFSLPDNLVEPYPGEQIPSPLVEVWQADVATKLPDGSVPATLPPPIGPTQFRLQRIQHHLVPRNQESFAPNPISQIFVQAILRHVRREIQASDDAKATVAQIRLVRERRIPFPPPPTVNPEFGDPLAMSRPIIRHIYGEFDVQ